jgi:dihydroorotase
VVLKLEGKTLSARPAAAVSKEGEQYFLSPGFIDLHVHVLDAFCPIGVKAGLIGLRDGVHLLADAGSAGAHTADAFPAYIFPQSEIPIKVWLNINAAGIVDLQECRDLRLLDVKKNAAYAIKHRDWICGVKVRSSADVVGEQGLKPLLLAKEAAREAGLPLMVHVGGGPPGIDEILKLLQKGDVVSHFLHGKGNRLFDDGGKPIAAFLSALDRGVLFDVAHGAGSFSYTVARQALDLGLRDFCISTDLHILSLPGAVKSLSRTMTKFYNLGYPLADIIRGVTSIPAAILRLDAWEEPAFTNPLKRATLFRLRPRRESDGDYVDSYGEVLPVSLVIEPAYTVVEGRCEELGKDGG